MTRVIQSRHPAAQGVIRRRCRWRVIFASGRGLQRISDLRRKFFSTINSFCGSRHNRRHNTRTTLIFKEFLRQNIPCAMVLQLISRSPRRPGSVASVARKSSLASLTPTLGCRDHATSPTRRRVRLVRHQRPSHPASNTRDDREAPLSESRTRKEKHQFRKKRK